jgi:diaminopimelate epimerase
MRSIKFEKFQSYGNDIVVFDGRAEELVLTEENVIYMSDRNFGIGCDEIIVISESSVATDEKAHNFNLQIFRPDGRAVGFSPNAFRVATVFLASALTKQLVRFTTIDGAFLVKFDKDTSVVKVNLGVPEVDGENVNLKGLHYVKIIENDSEIDFTHASETSSKNYMKINSRDEIFVRSVEFNGEIFTSPVGVAAAVAFGIKNGYLNNKVRVLTRGSDIMDSFFEIVWEIGKPLLQSAPCSLVFEGKISI